MARKTPLRALSPGETPAPEVRPMSLEEAAAAGDTLAELRALRIVNAKKMADPNISGRDLAALSRRQLEIAREIEAMVARAQQEADEDAGNATPDEDWDAEAI